MRWAAADEWAARLAPEVSLKHLARERCVKCDGAGTRKSRGSTRVICDCVFRRVFRITLGRWRRLGAVPGRGCRFHAVHCVDREGQARRLLMVSRPVEEFRADFELVARRALGQAPGVRCQVSGTGGAVDYQRLFELHFLEGARWRGCVRELKTNRGNFFRSVYKVQCVVGEALMRVRPYALYPLDGYFDLGSVIERLGNPFTTEAQRHGG